MYTHQRQIRQPVKTGPAIWKILTYGSSGYANGTVISITHQEYCAYCGSVITDLGSPMHMRDITPASKLDHVADLLGNKVEYACWNCFEQGRVQGYVERLVQVTED